MMKPNFNPSVSWKLFLPVFITAFTVIAIFSTVVIRVSNDWIVERAERDVEEAMENAGGRLDTFFESYVGLTMQVMSDPELQEHFHVLTGETARLQQIQAASSIDARVWAMEFSLRRSGVKMEIIYPSDRFAKEDLVQWMIRFENSKVNGMLTYWTAAGTLNDLVTQNNKATGGWWLYKWYGELTGNTVAVTPPTTNGSLQGGQRWMQARSKQGLFLGFALCG